MVETPSTTQSLAAHYYTEPAIFKREKQRVLATTWQLAGHVSQLEKPGDYFTFSIAGENLFAIKTKQGDIRAYYNVCQHRAHELVKGSGNKVTIVCPYHAWTYELTGELRSGPNIHSVPGFDKSNICLQQVLLEDFCGFIFANLDKDALPMDQWFPNAREELIEFVPHIDRLKPIEWIETSEKCNWKVSIENYSSVTTAN